MLFKNLTMESAYFSRILSYGSLLYAFITHTVMSMVKLGFLRFSCMQEESFA